MFAIVSGPPRPPNDDAIVQSSGRLTRPVSAMRRRRNVSGAYRKSAVRILNQLRQKRKETEMGRQVAVVLYVVAMAAVIVGVDFMFFRNRFWERLTVNIGIVLVFAAFYLRFLRRP